VFELARKISDGTRYCAKCNMPAETEHNTLNVIVATIGVVVEEIAHSVVYFVLNVVDLRKYEILC